MDDTPTNWATLARARVDFLLPHYSRMLSWWIPPVNLATERIKVKNREGKIYWKLCNARVVVAVVTAVMERWRERRKWRKERKGGTLYISCMWIPAFPLPEIKVVFSIHSFKPQAFHRWPEPILLNPNLPMNSYHLSSTDYDPKSMIKHTIPSSHHKV